LRLLVISARPSEPTVALSILNLNVPDSLSPLCSVPVHLTTLPAVTGVQPRPSTIVVPVGAVIVTAGSVAVAGPLFFTVTVTDTTSPTWPDAAVAVMARSAGLAVVNTVKSNLSSPGDASLLVNSRDEVALPNARCGLPFSASSCGEG